MIPLSALREAFVRFRCNTFGFLFVFLVLVASCYFFLGIIFLFTLIRCGFRVFISVQERLNLVRYL